MRPTRRGWTVTALATVLAVLAVVVARPLLLVGTALVSAWLLGHQYRFARDLDRTAASLSVVQSPAQTAVWTGDENPVTLTATRETDTALTLEITAGLPIGTRAALPFAVTLEPTSERAVRTQTVTWPVAGRHDFEPATVTATDGLFRETFTRDTTPTVTVDPPTPRTIHVGEGGDRTSASYGLHDAGQTGTGIEPAELREYVPGDAGNRIDWKATARHMTPYVREYEAETDRKTLLVVDHRESLAIGPRGETKLEYLREVALVIAGIARQFNDPLGLVTVGDEGITDRLNMTSPAANYTTIRHRLLDLEPTGVGNSLSGPAGSSRGGSTSPGNASDAPMASTAVSARQGSAHLRQAPTPADVQRSVSDLEGADDAFARTLRPFYADREIYRERIAEKPLYRAVHAAMANGQNATWTVICTDDSRPAELRETVKLARQKKNSVTVLIAPSVLYEPAGLADVDKAYDRYVAFEEFRRDLARLDGVTALEVGPADRLSAVLEAGRAGGEHT